MKCPTCSAENPESAKFCSECGLSLQLQEKEKAIAELEKAAELAARTGDKELQQDAEEILKELK